MKMQQGLAVAFMLCQTCHRQLVSRREGEYNIYPIKLEGGSQSKSANPGTILTLSICRQFWRFLFCVHAPQGEMHNARSFLMVSSQRFCMGSMPPLSLTFCTWMRALDLRCIFWITVPPGPTTYFTWESRT